ncbi:TRAP transporter substrate-binding protein [Pseudonocardia sichuanensis]
MATSLIERHTTKIAGAGLLVVALLLSACGGGSATGEATQTLRLGYIMAEGDPGDLGAKRFKEIVEERSAGSLEVLLQGNSLLGGEQDLWEGHEIGSVEMSLTGVGPISFFTPQYAGVQMYYAIEDQEHLEKVFNGEIGDEIEAALLQAKGGRVLDWWHRGPRQVTGNKPIRTPADLAGFKIRTPEGRTYIEAWQALGAAPTPMALGELFTALEQGVVDGQENPLALIATNSFDEVQSHVSLTGHQVAPYLLSISELTWQTLSDEEKRIVQEAALEAGTYEKQVVADSEETFKAELQQRGMTVVEDVDVDAFSEIMLETARRLEAEGLWQEGLYERMRELA